MSNSPRNALTDTQASSFFLAPAEPVHRQYEALRAYVVEHEPSQVVARRFAYSPGSFRVLCHQFRHEAEKRAGFFQRAHHGPRTAPVRDQVRDRAVALRKRNLSVYDIQRELAQSGQAVSVNALAVVLREEGFARLPRRRDEERPPTLKPDVAHVADVRRRDLTPRTFRTALAGVFLFVPLLHGLDLRAVVEAGPLPGSRMIPAEQALRTLLALKLLGTERKSHVMDLVFDPAVAVFAGLNVVPKRSYLAAYSSRVDHRVNVRIMDAWFRQVETAGLPAGASLDLDFHPVPAHSAAEPLEKHYLSQRSRREPGILVFLARDAEQRVFRYAHAGIPKADQANEILAFVAFWQRHTGHLPAELIFDSQLTTHENLAALNQQGIRFITLRRRSRQMLAAIYGRPASAWRRITLDAVTRTFRTPRVLDEQVVLRGYGPIRQLTILDLGHEEPTVLMTNHEKTSPATLITRYAQRMLIENNISESIQFFHLDALSSMVGLKVDFDLQLTLMAGSLYRLMAQRIGREYARAQPKRLFRNVLDLSARVDIEPERVVVTFDKRAHNPYLVASGLADSSTPMPWFGGKMLVLRFA